MNTLEELQARVKAATQTQTPLCITGGNTKAWYGNALVGEPFDVSGYQGIVSYEPTELVVTARCGTLLSTLEKTLAEKKQCLPFEPMQFGEDSTIGGVVSAGLGGPSRAYAGSVRDYLLGAQLLDGKGDVLTFGGQVMKNVAGYDVSRLLSGSLGSLGIITEMSLKVLPIAPAETTLQFEISEEAALQALNAWAGKPLPLNASCWHKGMLHVRLRGAQSALQAAQRSMGGQVVESTALWQSLRTQQHEFFKLQTDETLWRVGVPQVALPLNAGDTLIEWGGAQRWLKQRDSDKSFAAMLRALAQKSGGHATAFRGGDKSHTAFTPLAEPLLTIHRKLKAAFDPQNIFNRGRLFT